VVDIAARPGEEEGLRVQTHRVFSERLHGLPRKLAHENETQYLPDVKAETTVNDTFDPSKRYPAEQGWLTAPRSVAYTNQMAWFAERLVQGKKIARKVERASLLEK
jgi:hypothetical protein